MWDGTVPIFDQLVSELGYPFDHDCSITFPRWKDWTPIFSHYRIGHHVGLKDRQSYCATCEKVLPKVGGF